ncbi:hypothetical protein GOBAR_DD28407 [Gossypium barbadense]|nr:hypothetical protein GOBAR_DD28407 [Gossypium barbadense]
MEPREDYYCTGFGTGGLYQMYPTTTPLPPPGTVGATGCGTAVCTRNCYPGEQSHRVRGTGSVPESPGEVLEFPTRYGTGSVPEVP